MLTNDPSPTSEHPVFKELVVILRGIDHCPNPEDWEFKFCAGNVAEGKELRQCKRPTKTKDREKAEHLRSHLRLMKECPDTDEFFDELRQFINTSHCHSHARKALESFEKWKKIRATTVHQLAYQSPRMSDDERDSNLASLHAAAPMQPKSPDLHEAKQPEVTSETNAKTDTHVEAITDGISILTITATDQTETDTHVKAITDGISILTITATDQTETEAPGAERIIGVGLAIPKRNGTRRDHSPIFHEIYSPLNQVEKKYGVVYVLEHQTEEGLFKVGFTSLTAEERLKQSGNCYARNAKVIHETSGGAFFAAARAEKLAQTVLRYENLTISECDHCGGQHREWFRAPRELVLQTVENMEGFVKVPAYESDKSKDDEVCKLSEAAFEMIRDMCQFSPTKLRSALAIREDSAEAAPVSHVTEPKPKALVQATEIAVPPSSQDSDEGMKERNSAAATEAVGSGKGAKGTRMSLGATAALIGKGLIQGADKLKSNAKQLLNRPREGTPEPDIDGKTANLGQGNRSGSGNRDFHAGVGGLFRSLLPEDLKTFRADFEAEWKRQDGDWMQCPEGKESK